VVSLNGSVVSGQLSVAKGVCLRRWARFFSGPFGRGVGAARIEMGALGVFWGAWVLIVRVRLERWHGVKLPKYENVHFLTKRYRTRDSLI
jgi:hypothetical protein